MPFIDRDGNLQGSIAVTLIKRVRIDEHFTSGISSTLYKDVHKIEVEDDGTYTIVVKDDQQ